MTTVTVFPSTRTFTEQILLWLEAQLALGAYGGAKPGRTPAIGSSGRP